MKIKRCSVVIQMSDDVITEILSNLPVKSIHRFRLVSKTWRSLFSSPNFIKLHFNRAIEQDRSSLLLSDLKGEKYYLISGDLLPSNKTLNLIDYPFISSGKSKIIPEACCNGLFCCSYDRQFHIWNPSTNQYKTIPNSPIELSKFPATSASCGLGYDLRLDDYKFVIIYSLLDGANFFSGIEVYTLGSESWNRIEYIPYKILKPCRVNVFLNGALHWIVTRAPVAAGRCSSSYDVILSFDMVHETVKDVPLPKELNTKSSTLGVMRKRLCIFDNNKSKAQTQVWVMKEEEEEHGGGGGGSWTKLFSIQTDNETPLSFYLRPIKCFNNGLVLFQKGKTDLVLYDQKQKTFTKLGYISSEILAISYVGSLVSLNSTTYFKQSKNLVI